MPIADKNMESEATPSLAAVQDTAQLTSLLQSGACMSELQSLCSALQIRLKDLFPKPLEIFSTGDQDEIAQVRYQHYEKKRQFRLEKVLKALRRRGRLAASPLSHSPDDTHLRKTSTESTLISGTNRRGNGSISPVLQTETDTLHELEEAADMASTEISIVDRKREAQERRSIAQQRSLNLQLTDIAAKIEKLRKKELKLQLTKQEIKLTEREKQQKRELRSARIRENLQRKYKELEAFEKREARRELKTVPKTCLIVRQRCRSVVPSRIAEDRKEDEEVQRQLQAIQEKLENSAARVSQRRYISTLSFASRHDHLKKAQEKVKSEAENETKEAIELALRLQEQHLRSQQLREQHMLLRISQCSHRESSRSRMDTQRDSAPLCPYNDTETHKRKGSKVGLIKQEIAHLKRLDVAENLYREKESKREQMDSIIQKHQKIAVEWEKRSHERSVRDSYKLREDFKRQEKRERLKSSVTERIAELQMELIRTGESRAA